jgi:hypothetical protein
VFFLVATVSIAAGAAWEVGIPAKLNGFGNSASISFGPSSALLSGIAFTSQRL